LPLIADGSSTTTGRGYQYDANGNLTWRFLFGEDDYDFVYDAENRIYQAKKNGSVVATFTYDGDGNRVKSVQGSTTTAFVGTHFEWSGSPTTMVKYYSVGATRLAMRTGTSTDTTGLIFLLSDHLGSTSVSYNASSGATAKQLYYPWGELRCTSGTLPTDYTFTGQYSYATSDANDFGLMYYNARWSNILSTADQVI
jgi:YD repeat-containing protein